MAMDDQLTVIAHVRAKAGQEGRVRELLLGLVGPTRAEAGCIDYDLHESASNPALFVFYENWVSAAHLDAHAQSAHIQAFRKLAPELLDGSVEVTRLKAVSQRTSEKGAG
jgi:quinol monooxygenase YgiN